jgi:hypothetical protein
MAPGSVRDRRGEYLWRLFYPTTLSRLSRASMRMAPIPVRHPLPMGESGKATVRVVLVAEVPAVRLIFVMVPHVIVPVCAIVDARLDGHPMSRMRLRGGLR